MGWDDALLQSKESMEEFVCAENNGNHLAAEKYVMPQAKAPDF
jgi:hypothetical protein